MCKLLFHGSGFSKRKEQAGPWQLVFGTLFILLPQNPLTSPNSFETVPHCIARERIEASSIATSYNDKQAYSEPPLLLFLLKHDKLSLTETIQEEDQGYSSRSNTVRALRSSVATLLITNRLPESLVGNPEVSKPSSAPKRLPVSRHYVFYSVFTC